MAVPSENTNPPPDENTRLAFAALARIYAEADTAIAAVGAVCTNRAVCCDFDRVDHTLFATALEADYLLATHGPPARWEKPNQCPYQIDGHCTARQARPLGCRTYYCDPTGAETLHTLYERFYKALKTLIQEHHLPYHYTPLLNYLRSPPPTT